MTKQPLLAISNTMLEEDLIKDNKRKLAILSKFTESSKDQEKNKTCWQAIFNKKDNILELQMKELGLPDWIDQKAFSKNYVGILMKPIKRIYLHIAFMDKFNKKQIVRDNISWHMKHFLIIEIAVQFVDIHLLLEYKKAFLRILTAFSTIGEENPQAVDTNFVAEISHHV